MPLYEYECKECGAVFEAMSPMAKRDQMTCEECGSKRTERLASTFCSAVEGGTGAAGASAGGFPACGAGG
jgi:putative FmdB family regulatory protein